MSNVKQFKGVARTVFGFILALLVVGAAVTYFTDIIPVSYFTTTAFILVIVALALAYFGWLSMRSGILFVVMAVVLWAGIVYGKHPAVKADQYQAVFLTSGQVYFGHLHNVNTKNPTLTDVYYLRSNPQNPQTGSTNNNTAANEPPVSLVKLGNEIHGPEDVMALQADKILFWENLKEDGKVVKAIRESQK